MVLTTHGIITCTLELALLLVRRSLPDSESSVMPTWCAGLKQAVGTNLFGVDGDKKGVAYPVVGLELCWRVGKVRRIAWLNDRNIS